MMKKKKKKKKRRAARALPCIRRGADIKPLHSIEEIGRTPERRQEMVVDERLSLIRVRPRIASMLRFCKQGAWLKVFEEGNQC